MPPHRQLPCTAPSFSVFSLRSFDQFLRIIADLTPTLPSAACQSKMAMANKGTTDIARSDNRTPRTAEKGQGKSKRTPPTSGFHRVASERAGRLVYIRLLILQHRSLASFLRQLSESFLRAIWHGASDCSDPALTW